MAGGLWLAGCAAPAGPRGFGGPPPEPSEPTYVNPPNQPRLPGSSTAVKVGRVVYLSAQVSVDSAGAVVAPGDLAAQMRQALSNVSALVRAAQGVPGDVVKLTLYVVNYRPDQYPILQQAIEEQYGARQAPALTLVGVETLPMAGLLVSVDAVAVLRSQFPDRQRERGQ